MTNDPTIEKKFLRIKEAALMIGISDQSLRRWVDLGYIECIIFPTGERRFSIDEVNRVIDEMKTRGKRKQEG